MSDHSNENVQHYLPSCRSFQQQKLNLKDIFYDLVSATSNKKDPRNLSEGKTINYKPFIVIIILLLRM